MGTIAGKKTTTRYTWAKKKVPRRKLRMRGGGRRAGGWRREGGTRLRLKKKKGNKPKNHHYGKTGWGLRKNDKKWEGARA